MIGIPFGPGGPRHGQANGYEVIQSIVAPGANDRQIVYQFAFTAPPAATLRRVQIDDISEDQSGALIDVENPPLLANLWQIATAPLEATDPLVKWVYTVTPSLRVYRFTITDAAGQRTVLHQLAVYPDYFKAAIRRKWGEKY